MDAPTIKVWDPLVRLFHWSLVASFTIAWLTGDDVMSVHEWAGYAAGALVAFRVLWGLVGPKYARFGQFVRSPGNITRYLKAAVRGDEPRYIGHNPLGAWMVLALILAMAATAVTGWMMTLDAYWGVDWVEETHEAVANIMLVMVLAHVVGVLLGSYRHKENLVKAMIGGSKRAPRPADIA
ncbi:cytochrome b/b6 domain-containing protein [Afifella marina]|uniref:Cytochrome b n=1 Tax=Afifella marina DSM 2698 TaxID=1120955 RepID=A0A1G5PAL8_AFIMA|nr:cytochrome b/b6 domain-containing protein [Afifella marina]MBK1624395.1 cytochrome B [Afifella marina DSM 2698]MBK1628127.1 cytochrome B [Afifella marina]MBK5916561.1 cytochrome b [Afifella marina]RAI18928.1 cytochrome B [Afifella marina DSM 2698]SCZ46121.1 Cytochrome b [Afifella marina DSM 2698]